MQANRPFAPLLNAAFGILALLCPTPTPALDNDILAPLPAIAASTIDQSADDEATMAPLRRQAFAAMIKLQSAAK